MTRRRKKITTKIHLLIIIQTSMKTYIDTKLYECRNSKLGRGAVFFCFNAIELKTVIEHVVYLCFFCTFRSTSIFLYIPNSNPFVLFRSKCIFFYFDPNPFFCFIFRSTYMTIFSRKKEVKTDMHIHVRSEYRLITKYVR